MMPSRVKEVHACVKKHERGMEKDRGERERERDCRSVPCRDTCIANRPG